MFRTYLAYVPGLSIGHSGKYKTIKIVLGQTNQGAEDESFAVLPAYMPEFGDVKLDPVMDTVGGTYRIQQPNITVHTYILQGL